MSRRIIDSAQTFTKSLNSATAMDVDGALNNIITGIGELYRGELAGKRMKVANEAQSSGSGMGRVPYPSGRGLG